MKKTISFLLGLGMVAMSSAAIIVVDNNAGAPVKFTNLQNAIDSAKNGDTIYVQPSATGYGALAVKKKVFIIGGGVAPRKQNPTTTSTGTITIGNGSSGSIFMGLRIDGDFFCSDDSLNNILIANCQVGNTVKPAAECSNWIIEGCNLWGNSGGAIVIVNAIPNLLVQNCIFSYNGISLGTWTPGYLTFRNNLFILAGGEDMNNGNSYWPTTFLFENNTFFGVKIHASANGQWLNNCCYLCTGFTVANTGANSGNFTGNPLFVSFSSTPANFTSYYHDFTLQSGSPCIGTGTNGSDVGLYGGSKRYNPGLQPPIPQVVSIQLTNSAVPSGGKLEFKATLKKQD